MSEAFVQLPPNSTGVEIRVIQGDGTNQIPSGVTQEVVIPSDAVGMLPGDARQQGMTMQLAGETAFVLDSILSALRRIELILQTGLDTDISLEEELEAVD